jgi:hypothetical protein
MKMTYEEKKGRLISRTGWLIMGYIPVVLGVAAFTWAIAVHDWMGIGREHRAEQRSMQSVGISDPPKSQIRLAVHSSNCLVEGTGRMDGTDIWFYVRNKCGHWLKNPQFIYHVEAHDGTVIESAQYNWDGAAQIAPGERREQKISIKPSDRTESVEFWMVE